jgi:hypothetical protein
MASSLKMSGLGPVSGKSREYLRQPRAKDGVLHNIAPPTRLTRKEFRHLRPAEEISLGDIIFKQMA